MDDLLNDTGGLVPKPPTFQLAPPGGSFWFWGFGVPGYVSYNLRSGFRVLGLRVKGLATRRGGLLEGEEVRVMLFDRELQ